MDETQSRQHDWLRTALATVAVSAAFAALLTYFIAVLPDAGSVDRARSPATGGDLARVHDPARGGVRGRHLADDAAEQR